jgi:hypothetical protein
MKLRTHFPLSRLFLAAMLLPAASYAQFEGKTCTDIPASTNAVPSPGTGTFTVEGLTKFGLPAKSCATIGAFSGSTIDFDFTTTLATRYNNATFPSTCAGITYGLNGGPTYTAVTGKGKFAFDLTKPTAGVTGTLSATAFSQTDNLTLTAGWIQFCDQHRSAVAQHHSDDSMQISRSISRFAHPKVAYSCYCERQQLHGADQCLARASRSPPRPKIRCASPT